MLRIMAVILNLTAIGFVLYGIAHYGLPDNSASDDWFLILLLSILPIINLINIFVTRGAMSEVWPFIYFKRKALEERLKIEKLMQDNQREGNK